MSDQNKKGKKWFNRLKDNYRLVIMNNDTFEEVGSYKLSLLNVYILLSSAAILFAFMILLFIVFTPAKRLIPGYGDTTSHAELMRLNEKIEVLQNEAAIQKTYSEGFRKRLVADVETVEDVEAGSNIIPDSITNVERIHEDEILRKEMELEDLLLERELLSKAANISTKEVPLEQLFFIPPLTGLVSAGFDANIRHYGIDILAPKNTPVKSIMDGYVINSDWTLETGNTISVQHPNNIISSYKHNSVLLKKIGDAVKAGEALAIIGNTGTLSNGPHLHFELWHKGKAVDPSEYIIFE